MVFVIPFTHYSTQYIFDASSKFGSVQLRQSSSQQTEGAPEFRSWMKGRNADSLIFGDTQYWSYLSEHDIAYWEYQRLILTHQKVLASHKWFN